MVFVQMPDYSTLANVALILGGLVRAPMEEASTSTRSSSSCDLRSPLRMRSSPLITPYRRAAPRRAYERSS